MQPGVVHRVPDSAEVSLLRDAGVGEHAQSVVGVRGDDSLVERREPIVGGPHVHPLAVPQHGGDRGGASDVGQSRGERIDVRGRAADDRAPGGGAAELEHAVMLQEREQVPRGIGRRIAGARRPHAGDQGHREVRDEVPGESAGGQELAPRRSGLLGARQHSPRRPVEAGYLSQHPQVPRVDGPPALGEQAVESDSAGVGQAAPVAGDAHAHQRRAGLHAQLAEQPQQVGVGPLVVDDEAGVDAQPMPVNGGHVVGVGVPAQTPIGLEERHVVGSAEHVCGRQARDPGADHRHRRSRCAVHRKPPERRLV